MKVILGIFIGILTVVVVLVLVAGYFGFVPGISNIFGSNKPRDLGVTATLANYSSVTAKDNIQRVDLPADTPPAQSSEFLRLPAGQPQCNPGGSHRPPQL